MCVYDASLRLSRACVSEKKKKKELGSLHLDMPCKSHDGTCMTMEEIVDTSCTTSDTGMLVFCP